LRVQNWQLCELDDRIVWIALVQIIGQRLRPRCISCQRQGQSRFVLDVAAGGKLEGSGGPLPGLVRIPG
jgi:hypothetical protein